MIIPMGIGLSGEVIWPQKLAIGDRILITQDDCLAWNPTMDKYRGRWLTISQNRHVNDTNYKYTSYNVEEDQGSWNWHSEHVEYISIKESIPVPICTLIPALPII